MFRPYRRNQGNKYNNRSCKCLSKHIHDSRGEAGYCDSLLADLQAGKIDGYDCQKNYALVVNGHTICHHRVDFLVKVANRFEVHEYKGFETDVWKLKHKLFEACYPDIKYVVVRK